MLNYLQLSKNVLVIIAQIVILALIWLFANWFSTHVFPAIPASILGLFILLFLLFVGVPIRFFSFGAYWLIANMLLFFIPALVAIVNYKELIFAQGLGIIAVVCLSTLLVMAVSALMVEICYKWEIKLFKKYHNRQNRN